MTDREIKFRFWDKDKEYMEIDYWISWEAPYVSDVFNMNGLIPMQYTGLKDKNGTEIYEGDIVRDEDSFVQEVEYGKESDAGEGGYRGFYTGFHMNSNARKSEVIGNIYENPELINEKHE